MHRPTTANWAEHQQAARDENRLSIQLPATTIADAGRLQDLVRDTVERTLAEHGASAYSPPRNQDLKSYSLKRYIADALYRARLLGAGGLALAFGELSAIAGNSVVLGEADSSAIRNLLECAEDQSLHLYFPPSALEVQLLGTPCPLGDWLPEDNDSAPKAVIEYEAEDPGETQACGIADAELPSVAAFAVGASAAPRVSPPAATAPDTPAVPPVRGSEKGRELSLQADGAPSEPDNEKKGTQRQCETWASELENMSGRKVHSAIERVFANAYVPLHREAAAGKAPAPAQESLHRWGEDFAQGYSAAFDKMQHSRRRPKMVSDINQVAERWTEQHRVSQCELLVVSGLRYDLGELLRCGLEKRLENLAHCVEHSVLWAALPSNGRSQHLEAIPTGSGPTLTMHRLNSLDSNLVCTGQSPALRLNRLAQLLEEQLVPWIAERKPNTMVVIFGDHGFSLDSQNQGTAPASVGGALPEQVLVPAYAWIMAPKPLSRNFGSAANPIRPAQPLN